MNKGTLTTVVILVLILGLVAVFTLVSRNEGTKDGVTSDASKALASSVGSPYTDLEGNPVNFDVYEGKIRVVNSWASWCPFCVQELPDFSILSEEFSKNGVVVISINRKESIEQSKSFINDIGPLEGIIFVQDSGDIFYNAIGGFSMPETVFYDRNGNISTHKRGFMTLEEMRTLTEKAINETNEG